jgi:hypothetical protein
VALGSPGSEKIQLTNYKFNIRGARRPIDQFDVRAREVLSAQKEPAAALQAILARLPGPIELAEVSLREFAVAGKATH